MKLIRYRTTLCILIFATHAQANSHLAKPLVNQLPTPTTDQSQNSHLDLQEIFNNKHIQESATLLNHSHIICILFTSTKSGPLSFLK